MKILIVHASVGAGHVSAAKAIYAYFKEREPQCDIRIIDVLRYSTRVFRSIYIRGYSFLIKYLPCLWELGFLLTANRFLRPVTVPLGGLLHRLNAVAFRRLLIREDFDVIISTHFLPSAIASELKSSQRIGSELFTVVTDYVVHSLWLCPRTDLYLVASGITKESLIAQGIGGRQIIDTGIPIHPKFLAKYDREAVAEKLGLDKDKFTVLVVTGSFGIGPIERIVNLLYKDAQLLVVCARNKGLYDKLKERGLPEVHAYAFVDNIQELMAASDMIVTKPGGLTVSEVLAMELPPIFIYPIPGQETGNVSVLKEYGIGFSPRGISAIRDIVLEHKAHPDKLSEMKDKIRSIKKTDTLGEIFDVVRASGGGPAC